MKIANNSAYVQTGTFTVPPQSHLGRAASPPLWQSSPAACATIYAMPTADKSSDSATGTLYIQTIQMDTRRRHIPH